MQLINNHAVFVDENHAFINENFHESKNGHAIINVWSRGFCFELQTYPLSHIMFSEALFPLRVKETRSCVLAAHWTCKVWVLASLWGRSLSTELREIPEFTGDGFTSAVSMLRGPSWSCCWGAALLLRPGESAEFQ